VTRGIFAALRAQDIYFISQVVADGKGASYSSQNAMVFTVSLVTVKSWGLYVHYL
jgi:hypothetical protein